MAIDVNDLPVEDFSLDASTLPVEDFSLPVSQPIDSTALPVEDFSLPTPSVEPAIAETTAVPLGEPVEPTATTPEELFTGTGEAYEEVPESPGLQLGKAFVEALKQTGKSVGGTFKGIGKTFGDQQAKAIELLEEQLGPGQSSRELEMLREHHAVLKGAEKTGEKILKAKILKPDESFKKLPGVAGYIQDVVMAAPFIAGTTAATIAGGPAAGIAFSGSLITGSTYNNLIEQGVEPERAILASLANAAVQSALEQVGIGKALKVFKPGKLAKKALREIAETGAVEFLTEVVQKYPEAIAEIWARGESPDEFINNFWSITKEGLREGLVALPFAGVTATAGVATRKRPPKGSELEVPPTVSPETQTILDENARVIEAFERAKQEPATPEKPIEITPEPQKQVIEPKKVEPIPEVVEPVTPPKKPDGVPKKPKIELTPEEKGFVEKVRPKVTIQEPKKVEKPKIEKPKKVKPVVEKEKPKINKDGEVILKPTKKRLEPPKREVPPPVKTIDPKTQKPITDPEKDVRSFQQAINRPEVDSEILPETVKEKFIRKMQDKANRIKTVQDVIAPDLSDDVNTYVRQDLMAGRTEDALEEFRDNEVKPLEKKMTGFKTELENLEDYAYAKHAPEANAHIKKIRFNMSGEALGIKEAEVLNESDALKENADELGGEKANYQRKLKVENLTDAGKKRLNEKIVGVDKKLDNINKKIGKMNTQLKEMGIKVEEYKGITESGSGMTNEQAADIIAKVEASGKKKQYESLHKDLKAITKETARIRFEGGLIDQKEYDRLTNFYKHYVPLQGIGEEVKEKRKLLGIGKRGGGRDIRGPEHKRRLGRKSKASKILAHAMYDRTKAIARAEENRVRQTFLRFVQQNPNKDLWEVDEVKYKPFFNKNTGQVENRQARDFDLTEEERAQRLGVKVDGKGFEITIKDPILARAMKNLGADKKGKVIQTFAAFNRYLALVNTAYSLGFIPTNFSRDIQTMAINMTAEESLKTTKNILKDIPAAVIAIGKAEVYGGKETKWTKYYTEFKKAGGKIGFYGLKDADRLQKDIMNELFLMKGGLKTQPARVYKAVGKFVMGNNAAVESGTRLATYVNMRKLGYSKEKSASIAKNITVNFNKQGELGPYFNALYVFANAQIQGTARLLTTLTAKKSRGRAAVLVSGISAGSFLIAQLARVMGGQDDDDVYYYDKIPPWVRENHIVVMRPGEKSLGKDGFLESIHYVKIPVPYGFNVFHALGQAVDVSLYDPDDGAIKGAKMIASSIGNAFNPMGSASTLLQTITPTAFRWLADLGLNMNFFGAPIERKQADYEVKKAKSELYFKSTSETSKQISKGLNLMSGGETHEPGFLNISPDAIDHVAEFLTGGAGRTLNQTVSLAAKLGTKKPITVREIPVARRFLGEIPKYEDISRLYKNTDRIRVVKKQYETFLTVDKRKAIEYRKEHKGLLWFTDKRKDAEGKSRPTVLKTFEKEMKSLKNRRDELEAAGKDVEKINEVLLNKTKKFNKVFNQKKQL